MRSQVLRTALAAVVASCLPAWSAPPSGKWSQPVDTTNPTGQISETCPVTVPSPGIRDVRSADTWESFAESPSTSSSVSMIKWWGCYRKYEENNAGPVDPPAVLPASFLLMQYENDAADPDNAKPGAMIARVESPLAASTTAACTQTYVRSVKVADGPPAEYVHIFSYKANLDSPFMQTKDSTYWLSIQAKYDTDPASLSPQPYVCWEWLNTPPDDSAGSGQTSADGGATWTRAEYAPSPDPYAGKPYHFAFELDPLEIIATPARFAPNKQTRVRLVANIPPIGRDFIVYVVVTRLDKPNKPVVSLVPKSQVGNKRGPVEINIPCVPLKGVIKALARGTATTVPEGANVTIFDDVVSFDSPRQFMIKIGFFDPRQPVRSENDAFLLSSTQVVIE